METKQTPPRPKRVYDKFTLGFNSKEMKQNCKKLKAKIDDLSTDCDVGSWTWHDSMNNILEEFTSKLIHQAKQEEKEKILKWAKNYIKIDMKIYGTDKHGIALEDLENFCK